MPPQRQIKSNHFLPRHARGKKYLSYYYLIKIFNFYQVGTAIRRCHFCNFQKGKLQKSVSLCSSYKKLQFCELKFFIEYQYQAACVRVVRRRRTRSALSRLPSSRRKAPKGIFAEQKVPCLRMGLFLHGFDYWAAATEVVCSWASLYQYR